MASIQFDASLDTSKLDQSIEENKKSLATWLEDVRKLGAEFDQIFAKIGEAKNIDIQVNKDSAIQQVNDLTTSINDIAPTVPVTVEVENIDQSQQVMADYITSLTSDFSKIDQAYWQNNQSAQESITEQTQLVATLSAQVEELEAQMANVGQPGGLAAGSEQFQAVQTSLATSKQQLTKESDRLTLSMEKEIGKFNSGSKSAGGFNQVLKGVGASILKYASWTAIAGAGVKIFHGAIDSGSLATERWRGFLEGLTGAIGQFYAQVRQGSMEGLIGNMVKAGKAAKEFKDIIVEYDKYKAAATILNTADADQLNKLEAIFRNTTKSFEEKNKALQEYKKIKTESAEADFKASIKMVEGFESKIKSTPGLEWVTPEQLKLMETIYFQSGDLMKQYYDLRDATKLMSDTVFLDPGKYTQGWGQYSEGIRKSRAELEKLAGLKGFSISDLLAVGKLETDLSKKTIQGLGGAYAELGQNKAKISDINANIARTEAMVSNSFVGEIGSIGKLMDHISKLEKLKKETANPKVASQLQGLIDAHNLELQDLDPVKRRALQKEIDDMRIDYNTERKKQLLAGFDIPQADMEKQLLDLQNQYDKDVSAIELTEKKKNAIYKKYLLDREGIIDDFYRKMQESSRGMIGRVEMPILGESGDKLKMTPGTAEEKRRTALQAQLKYLDDQYKKDTTRLELSEKQKTDITRKYLLLRLEAYKKYWIDSGRAEDAGKLRGLDQNVLDANERLKQQMAEQAEKAEMLAPALYGASDAAQYLSGLFNQGNEEFAGMLQGFGKLSGMAADWYKKGYFNLSGNLKTMGKGEAMTNIIGGATDLIGMFVNQSQENKAKMKQYYDYVIQQQADYNLLLNEQIRLNSEQSGNVFLSDYVGKITDGTKAYNDAMQKYYAGIKELSKAQATAGMKSAVSGANVLQGMGAGAGLGAGIGTMIMPGIGTAIGAGIGAVVGGIAGLFAKKKKDIMQPLLAAYPDLIKANGELNMSLAQTILDNNLIADGSRQVLQNIVDWKAAAEEANAQIEGVISDLAGALGSELSNALVKAFTDGTDSAVAFGNTVDKILSDIMAQLVFNAVFQENFDALQKRMKESYDPTSVNYDMNWVDDFADWAKEMKTKLPVYTTTMREVQSAAASQGINLWRPETSGSGGMSNIIQRQITEETGNELAGLLRMIADDNRGNRDYNKLAVDHLVMIEANTFNTVEELKLAVAELKVISINTQKEYAGALVG